MIPHGLAVVQAQTCRQFNDSMTANVRNTSSETSDIALPDLLQYVTYRAIVRTKVGFRLIEDASRLQIHERI